MGALTRNTPRGVAADGADVFHDVFQHAENAVGGGKQLAPCFCQAQRARGAVDQFDAEFGFEISDAFGSDGARHPMLFRCLREAAERGDADERAQGVQVPDHGNSKAAGGGAPW